MHPENNNKKEMAKTFNFRSEQKQKRKLQETGRRKWRGGASGPVNCELSDFVKAKEKGGKMGVKVTVEIGLEQVFRKDGEKLRRIIIRRREKGRRE